MTPPRIGWEAHFGLLSCAIAITAFGLPDTPNILSQNRTTDDGIS